jgi:hypothetical protein
MAEGAWEEDFSRSTKVLDLPTERYCIWGRADAWHYPWPMPLQLFVVT